MNELILNETFDHNGIDQRLKWYCPPARYEINNSNLVVFADAKTDYWQKTHYGFSADNGHFLYAEQNGDFSLTTRVRFTPAHKYDQAGLLVRFTPDFWIKTSVEYETPTLSYLGVVLTRHGYSDWSTQKINPELNEITLRIRRESSNFFIEFLEAYNPGTENENWTRIRMAHLKPDQEMPIQAGLYAASPKEAGFKAEFDYLKIEKTI
ncbi:MAG: DUF1349 domain-containing protein [Anaerolineae bacterium]|nr:DUF1349 domain-containing protein [Anaerolineae bacterium]